MKDVASALLSVRVPAEPEEYDIHALVASTLQSRGISFQHECPLAPRCRIDFLVGSVGIEIKKGRPGNRTLQNQLERYLKSDLLDGILVVVQKNVDLPSRICGKPVLIVSLNRNWGVALP